MSGDNLSGEEKRRQLKEQFKQDLRERKAFLEQVQKLKGQQKVLKAIEGLNPEDDTDEWINKLNEETAFNEAKMELALESAPPANEEKHQPSEEELKKATAEELVRKLKEEMSNPASQSISAPADEKKAAEKPPRNMLDESV